MFAAMLLSKDSHVLFACAGLQMLDALEGMHRLGFIHRDVKPANFVMFPQWCSNLGSDEGKQNPAGGPELPQAMLLHCSSKPKASGRTASDSICTAPEHMSRLHAAQIP